MSFDGPNQRPGLQAATAAPALLAVLLVTIFITTASYPGFMSFDSIEALRQARFRVDGSQYPPFGSYVWRVFDDIWPGPTLMQFAQNTLLLGSFIWILHLLRWRSSLQILALVMVVALPPILGTMLVVWKDVAVAAFYLSGFATLFFVQQRSPFRRGWLIALAVLLVFCGMAYRFNAASGAAPLLVYAAWLALRGDTLPVQPVKTILIGATLLFALFLAVWAVNSFRFPTLARLERNTNMDIIMGFDLVGISRYAGVSVLPARDGGLVPIEYVQRIYDPRHLNFIALNDVEKRLAKLKPEEIVRTWLSAVKTHPAAYLRHRAEVFRVYLGLQPGEMFYVTHPSVDQNELGVTHTPNALTRIAVGYVWERRDSFLIRPWVYYAAAMLALATLFAFRGSGKRMEASIALGSSLLYLAPMFFITPAGDLRYNFWSIWGALCCIVFMVSGVRNWCGRTSSSGHGGFSQAGRIF